MISNNIPSQRAISKESYRFTLAAVNDRKTHLPVSYLLCVLFTINEEKCFVLVTLPIFNSVCCII